MTSHSDALIQRPLPRVGSRVSRRSFRVRIREWIEMWSRLDDPPVLIFRQMCDSLASATSPDEIPEIIAAQAKVILRAARCSLIVTAECNDDFDFDRAPMFGDALRTYGREAEMRKAAAEAFLTAHWVSPRVTEEGLGWAVFPLKAGGMGVVGILCAEGIADRRVMEVIASASAPSLAASCDAQRQETLILTAERQRIAGELHDNIVQSLFAVSLGLEVCKREAGDDPGKTGMRLAELQSQVNTSMNELRRFVYNLRPVSLSELGLVSAVEQWAKQIARDSALSVNFAVEGAQYPLPPSAEACLYRVAKEGTVNAVKHSRGDEVTIRLQYASGHVRLEVRDNGCGFDPNDIPTSGVHHLGLRNIERRVARQGGRMQVKSMRGTGTSLVISLPYERVRP